MWTDHILFSLASVGEHVGCFHLSAAVATRLRFSCSCSESRYLRDRCWQEQKVCFMQAAGALGRRWTRVPEPVLKIPLNQEGFSREKGSDLMDRRGQGCRCPCCAQLCALLVVSPQVLSCSQSARETPARGATDCYEKQCWSRSLEASP